MMFNNVFRTSKKCINREVIKRYLNKVCSFSPNDGVTFTKNKLHKCLKFKNINNRYFSTLNVNVQTQSDFIVSTDDVQKFTDAFSGIVKDLTEASRRKNITGITGYYERMLDYNNPHRKPSIGHRMIVAYKMLESHENLTSDNIRLANILGWCSELLASSFCVNDDVMDASETQNGLPCWYKIDEIGLQAINDALMLENGLYSILKKHFSALRCYPSIIELFHDVSMNTSMGQSLDTMTMKNGKPLLDLFTMSRYNAITKYRASYLMFKLPVGLAMYLANMDDPNIHTQANAILLKIGQICQIHNDVLDCFGNPGMIDQNSHNIRNGKCTWLIVEALHRANAAQRQLLEKNYGRPEPECEAAVKAVFEDLDLLNSYSICNKLTVDFIRQDIKRTLNKPLQKLFTNLVQQYDSKNKNFFKM